jgi:hypothetical protein
MVVILNWFEELKRLVPTNRAIHADIFEHLSQVTYDIRRLAPASANLQSISLMISF